MTPRRTVEAVEGTRAEALRAAVRDASVVGFGGLTLGRLADRLKVSKSGLFGLFGSKEELQRAALRQGAEIFMAEVWQPASELPAGRLRLLALCDHWIDHFERDVFPGGCLMTTAAVEFDARPGALHDDAAELFERWFGLLEREIASAVELGELPSGTKARDLAFELNALASAGSWRFHLSGDRDELERARRLMRVALSGD